MSDARPAKDPGIESEYPKNYDVPALRERRFLWTARLFALVALVSVLLNVMLGAAMFSLAPLKEVRPFMVQFAEKSEVVSTIRPIRAEAPGFDVLTESLVRRYVVRRETIPRTVGDNVVPLEEQWGPNSFVRRASTDEVYRTFAAQTSQLIPEVRKTGKARSIEVVAVSELRPLEMYQVEFEATIYDAQMNVERTSVLEATLTVAFRAQQGLTRTQALVNPTGFVVTSYNRVQKAQ